LAVKVFALVDSVIRPSKAYDAVGKLPKVFWLIVLFLAVATQVAVGLSAGWPASWLGLLGLIGIIAALVYLFGMRPELIRYSPRRRPGKSNDGPSGSW
jgi:uncharacterized protein (DUF2062 family)